MQEAAKKSYWNPYFGGALLGVVLFLSFFVTGHGLGSSGGIQHVVVALEDVVAREHVDTTPYVASIGGGDKNPLDSWLVWEVLGAILGGFVSGLVHRRVKVETYHGPRITPKMRWGFAFFGGAIVGYGARFARGCTSGQGLSGGAVMSAGSWTFMLALFAGGYLTAYFVRRLWRPEGGAQ